MTPAISRRPSDASGNTVRYRVSGSDDRTCPRAPWERHSQARLAFVPANGIATFSDLSVNLPGMDRPRGAQCGTLYGEKQPVFGSPDIRAGGRLDKYTRAPRPRPDSLFAGATTRRVNSGTGATIKLTPQAVRGGARFRAAERDGATTPAGSSTDDQRTGWATTLRPARRPEPPIRSTSPPRHGRLTTGGGEHWRVPHLRALCQRGSYCSGMTFGTRSSVFSSRQRW